MKSSLHSGDAVIVTGRLKVREWENSAGKKNISVDIEAESVGHDLRWGASAFARSSRLAGTMSENAARDDASGSSEEESNSGAYGDEAEKPRPEGELVGAVSAWDSSPI